MSFDVSTTERVVSAIDGALAMTRMMDPMKKRYVQAVLISCIGDMTTGRMSFSEQDAFAMWLDQHALVDTILRLALPWDVPEDAPWGLRERAEARRHLLDPAFVVQPFLPEDL